ncbi:hypothetical protein NQD34_010040 [Periophthalmus magnuspinnatus]|nr:hypothetical protein NQD34_010040 [Periophthalmus magnuspinnatus]
MLRGCVVRSLLLCVWYVSALTLPRCPKTTDGFNLLQGIRAKQPSWGSETLLYTPTHLQYRSCPSFSMGCIESEMKTLLEEWTIDDTRIRVRILRILRVLKLPKNQEQDCESCELFSEEPAPVFLDFLNSTFQEMNSSC